MLRVLIIDDEPPALKMMEDLLKQYACIEIAGCFTEYSVAIEYTDLNTIDAIFIDIQLSNINGIDAGYSLKELNRAIDIVFVTSYEHYTLEAFEVSATDYLLKPVFKERLNKTIDRLLDKQNLNKNIQELKKIKTICFQEFNVLDSNDLPIKWRTAKTRELAAFLFHHKGEFIHKDIILENLFGGHTDSDRLLYTTVYYLRTAFKKLGLKDVVILKNSSYRIELDAFTTDVICYDHYLTSPTIEAIEKSVSLYKGDYFYFNDYLWAYNQREFYRVHHESLLKKLCDHYFARSDYTKIIHYAKLSLESNPFQENISIMLINAYYEKQEFLILKSFYEQTIRLYNEELFIQIPSSIHDEYLRIQRKAIDSST